MIFLLAGCSAFVLFLLYDLNQIYFHCRALRLLFAGGFLLLIGATILLTVTASHDLGLMFWLRCLSAILAVLFLALLIYTLFFALPFSKTYVEQKGKYPVCDRGVYALCRHPGVLWLTLFYLFYALVCNASLLLWATVVFTVCNLLYVVFEDLWFFPNLLVGYELYRKTTPFLLPDSASFRRCFQTLLHQGSIPL